MRQILRNSVVWAVAATACGTFPGPLSAGGFAVAGQGSKALGLAGAYVAQADDATAVFFNPGALFLVEKKLAAGLSLPYLNEGLFQGLSPGSAVGTTGELDSSLGLLPHVYLVQPLNKSLRLGLGFYSPFWLRNEWEAPDSFSGRALSTKSEIDTYDLAGQVGVKLTPNLGLGAGGILRISSFAAGRRVQVGGLDVASWDVQGDTTVGIGFQFGLLYQASQRLALGLAYRSNIDMGHDGVGLLTQIETGNTQLDELIAATFPLDQNLATETDVDYPGSTTVGVAFEPSRQLLFELDVEWTDWSRMQSFDIAFLSEPDFSTSYDLAFDDTLTFRLGAQYSNRTGSIFRFGVALDESPQPDETVGAFLADADRTLFSVGFTRDWLDVAFTWIASDQRIVRTNFQDFNGSYRASSLILGITVTR